MTLAKGIASSYIPFGAVAVSAEINAPFEAGETHFIHGFTNGGHPLGCAAGAELIDIIRDENLLENCRKQSEVLFSYREKLLAHPTVRDVRGWGLMMVLELIKDKQTLEFFDPALQAEKLYSAITLKLQGNGRVKLLRLQCRIEELQSLFVLNQLQDHHQTPTANVSNGRMR